MAKLRYVKLSDDPNVPQIKFDADATDEYIENALKGQEVYDALQSKGYNYVYGTNPVRIDDPDNLDDWDITRGIKSGVDSLKMLYAGASAAWSDVFGNEEAQAKALEDLRQYQLDASVHSYTEKDGKRVKAATTLEEVFASENSIDSFLDWLLYNMGQGAVTTTPIVLAGLMTGGTGAAVMGAVARKAAGGWIKAATTPYLGKTATSMVGKIAARQTSPLGIGVLMAGQEMGLGDIYGDMAEKDADPNAALAFAYSLPYAGAEGIFGAGSLLLSRIFAKGGKDVFKDLFIERGRKEAAKVLAKNVGMSTAGEAVAEGLQESIIQTATAQNEGQALSDLYNDKEFWKRVGEGAAAGAAGGMGFGVIGGSKNAAKVLKSGNKIIITGPLGETDTLIDDPEDVDAKKFDFKKGQKYKAQGGHQESMYNTDIKGEPLLNRQGTEIVNPTFVYLGQRKKDGKKTFFFGNLTEDASSAVLEIDADQGGTMFSQTAVKQNKKLNFTYDTDRTFTFKPRHTKAALKRRRKELKEQGWSDEDINKELRTKKQYVKDEKTRVKALQEENKKEQDIYNLQSETASDEQKKEYKDKYSAMYGETYLTEDVPLLPHDLKQYDKLTDEELEKELSNSYEVEIEKDLMEFGTQKEDENKITETQQKELDKLGYNKGPIGKDWIESQRYNTGRVKIKGDNNKKTTTTAGLAEINRVIKDQVFHDPKVIESKEKQTTTVGPVQGPTLGDVEKQYERAVILGQKLDKRGGYDLTQASINLLKKKRGELRLATNNAADRIRLKREIAKLTGRTIHIWDLHSEQAPTPNKLENFLYSTQAFNTALDKIKRYNAEFTDEDLDTILTDRNKPKGTTLEGVTVREAIEFYTNMMEEISQARREYIQILQNNNLPTVKDWATFDENHIGLREMKRRLYGGTITTVVTKKETYWATKDGRANLTPIAKKNLPVIKQRLIDALDKMNLSYLNLKFFDEYFDSKTGEEVNGSFMVDERLVNISLSATKDNLNGNDSRMFTLYHEAVHALFELGLFSKQEEQSLRKAARKSFIKKYKVRERYKTFNYTESQLEEEAISDAFAQFAINHQSDSGRVKTLFQRLLAYILGLRDALLGNKFSDVEQIFNDTHLGFIGERHFVQESVEKSETKRLNRNLKSNGVTTYFRQQKLLPGKGDVPFLRRADSELRLTKKEIDFLNLLFQDGEIYEYAPSAVIEGNMFKIHSRDIEKLNTFIDEVAASEKVDVGGEGANLVPPRFRTTTNNFYTKITPIDFTTTDSILHLSSEDVVYRDSDANENPSFEEGATLRNRQDANVSFNKTRKEIFAAKTKPANKETFKDLSRFSKVVGFASEWAQSYKLFTPIFETYGLMDKKSKNLQAAFAESMQKVIAVYKNKEARNLFEKAIIISQEPLMVNGKLVKNPGHYRRDANGRIVFVASRNKKTGGASSNEVAEGEVVILEGMVAEAYEEAVLALASQVEENFRGIVASTFKSSLEDMLGILATAQIMVPLRLQGLPSSLEKLTSDQLELVQYADIKYLVEAAQAALELPELPQATKDQISQLLGVLGTDGTATGLLGLLNEAEKMNKWKQSDYFPLQRYGNHYVKVTSRLTPDEIKEGRTKGSLLWYEYIEADINPLTRTSQFEQIKQKLAIDYPDADISEIKKIDIAEVKKDLGEGFAGIDALSQHLSDVNSKNYDLVRTEMKSILGSIADGKKLITGFDAFITGRKQLGGVAGYDGDFLRGMMSFGMISSEYAAKSRFMREIEDHKAVFKEGYPKESRIYNAVMNPKDGYLQYIDSPKQEHSNIRRMAFWMFLGGNASSALLQTMSLIQFTGPLLSQYAGSLATSKELGIAVKDVFKTIVRPGNSPYGDVFVDVEKLPDDVKDKVKAAIRDGTIKQGQIMQEIGQPVGYPTSATSGEGTAKRALHDLEQTVIGGMFNTMETVSRMTAYIAALRLADKNANVIKKADEMHEGNELWEYRKKKNGGVTSPEMMANFVVERTFGEYGKRNRPYIARNVGSILFLFTTYIGQMFALNYRLATQGGTPAARKAGRRAFIKMMLMVGLTTGFLGLPGVGDAEDFVSWVMSQVTGVQRDYSDQFREMLMEAGYGPKFIEFLMNGVFSAYGGIDIARRAGMQIPGSQQLKGAVSMFGLNTGGQATDLTGAPGAMIFGSVGNIVREVEQSGFKSLIPGMGRDDDAFYYLFPHFIQNIHKAGKYGSSGVVETNNGTILAKDLSALELLGQSLGFTPSSVSRAREAVYKERMVGGATNVYRKRMNSRIQLAMLDILVAMEQNDSEKNIDAQARLMDIYRQVAQFNRSHDMNHQFVPEIDRLLEAARKKFDQTYRIYKSGDKAADIKKRVEALK